jgi:hypothetical protein
LLIKSKPPFLGLDEAPTTAMLCGAKKPFIPSKPPLTKKVTLPEKQV